jgi:hypothetical protein
MEKLLVNVTAPQVDLAVVVEYAKNVQAQFPNDKIALNIYSAIATIPIKSLKAPGYL